MNYVCTTHEFKIAKSDMDKASQWSAHMASFYNHTIDHVRKTYYLDGKRKILPRVHGVWDSIKQNAWAQRLTTAWAWYGIADVIDLVHKYDFKKGNIAPLDPWPISVKTLRWSDVSGVWRLVIPGCSIDVSNPEESYDSIFGGNLWSGNGRVQIGSNNELWFTFYCLSRRSMM